MEKNIVLGLELTWKYVLPKVHDVIKKGLTHLFLLKKIL